MSVRPVTRNVSLPGFKAVAMLLFAAAFTSSEAVAQGRLRESSTTARVPKQTSREMQLLDEWVARRFKDVQLLPDTIAGARTLATDAPLPHVEGIIGTRGDTLVALHFSARPSRPALAVPGQARLAVPTGAITPTAARVVARRQFRAPRVPNASVDKADDWRYGWLYLAVLPRTRDALPPTARRGWLLIE